MKTKAAVLWESGRDWEVVELELDEPKGGEVLIRWEAAGFCHSDEHLRTRVAAAGGDPLEALACFGRVDVLGTSDEVDAVVACRRVADRANGRYLRATRFSEVQRALATVLG